MKPIPEHPTEWQLIILGDDHETLVADLVPLAADQTGLLSIRLGIENDDERSILRECLQQCADTSVPVTLRWMESSAGSVLLLTTADGMLVVTACDKP
jgi:hypothetical protein